ncbi:DUF937 domain-containing protein [Flavobacterium sp. TSSA_36]|jgi:hypothetical protein|uniref:DUF937 domain-containing protein n=1 Tax=Flavobacterium sp. TSSA_36 TaxID=3447669 RepID=UPI003F314435
MFEQLTQLVQQFGEDTVVKNSAIPNEHNEAVMQETGNSILSSLQQMASGGGIEQLAGLLKGNTTLDGSNPAVQQITEQVTGNLSEKFGLSSETASSVAGGMIPQILGGLMGKANDPNDSFQISDIIGAISGNSEQASGIMDTISKYGTQFGLDQNADGKVDISDAMNLAKGSGGIGGILGKLFGK